MKALCTTAILGSAAYAAWITGFGRHHQFPWWDLVAWQLGTGGWAFVALKRAQVAGRRQSVIRPPSDDCALCGGTGRAAGLRCRWCRPSR